MPRIDNAFFGTIIIDGKKYDTDVTIHWDGEIQERAKSHKFSKRELMDVLMKNPEVVIVGTGTAGYVKIDPDAEVAAKLDGIEFIAKPTLQAVEEFNKLARRKKVTAVFHITD